MSSGTLVHVVFDLENGEVPTPIGTYAKWDEDVCVYVDPHGTIKHAPGDCVRVVPVHVPSWQPPVSSTAKAGA